MLERKFGDGRRLIDENWGRVHEHCVDQGV
jgi:hypothetical protein